MHVYTVLLEASSDYSAIESGNDVPQDSGSSPQLRAR